jgi:rubrerythrin
VPGRRDQGTGVPSTPGLSPPVNRLREIEAALEVEQDTRQRSERLLAEAQSLKMNRLLASG